MKQLEPLHSKFFLHTIPHNKIVFIPHKRFKNIELTLMTFWNETDIRVYAVQNLPETIMNDIIKNKRYKRIKQQ